MLQYCRHAISRFVCFLVLSAVILATFYFSRSCPWKFDLLVYFCAGFGLSITALSRHVLRCLFLCVPQNTYKLMNMHHHLFSVHFLVKFSLICMKSYVRCSIFTINFKNIMKFYAHCSIFTIAFKITTVYSLSACFSLFSIKFPSLAFCLRCVRRSASLRSFLAFHIFLCFDCHVSLVKDIYFVFVFPFACKYSTSEAYIVFIFIY